MNIIRYILSVLLGILGLYIIVMNWFIVFYNIKNRNNKKYVSLGPLLGGISLCIAIVLIPNNRYVWLCLLPLFIDVGCLPSIIGASIRFIKDKYKKY